MADRTLHKYSLGEELVSAISHGVGALLSLAGTVVLIFFAASTNDTWKIVSVSIYGASMIILYTISTVYHSLKPNSGKKVMRILDHCVIYLLIFGTYTPFVLVTLRGWLGWLLFGINLAAAAVGTTLTAIDFKKFGKFAMVCYLAMGWVVVIGIVPLIKVLPLWGLIFLLAGGIFYTVGAVLYGLGKKKKYMHSLWHFFVLAGTIFQYFSILFYVIL